MNIRRLPQFSADWLCSGSRSNCSLHFKKKDLATIAISMVKYIFGKLGKSACPLSFSWEFQKTISYEILQQWTKHMNGGSRKLGLETESDFLTVHSVRLEIANLLGDFGWWSGRKRNKEVINIENLLWNTFKRTWNTVFFSSFLHSIC